MKPYLLLLVPSLIWYKMHNPPPLLPYSDPHNYPLNWAGSQSSTGRATDSSPRFFLPNKISEKRKIGLIPKPANVDIFMRPKRPAAGAGAAAGTGLPAQMPLVPGLGLPRAGGLLSGLLFLANYALTCLEFYEKYFLF